MDFEKNLFLKLRLVLFFGECHLFFLSLVRRKYLDIAFTIYDINVVTCSRCLFVLVASCFLERAGAQRHLRFLMTLVKTRRRQKILCSLSTSTDSLVDRHRDHRIVPSGQVANPSRSWTFLPIWWESRDTCRQAFTNFLSQQMWPCHSRQSGPMTLSWRWLPTIFATIVTWRRMWTNEEIVRWWRRYTVNELDGVELGRHSSSAKTEERGC